MARVNQAGQPIEEETILFYDELTGEDLQQAVILLLVHLKLDLVRTNATENGERRLVLRPKEN